MKEEFTTYYHYIKDYHVNYFITYKKEQQYFHNTICIPLDESGSFNKKNDKIINQQIEKFNIKLKDKLYGYVNVNKDDVQVQEDIKKLIENIGEVIKKEYTLVKDEYANISHRIRLYISFTDTCRNPLVDSSINDKYNKISFIDKTIVLDKGEILNYFSITKEKILFNNKLHDYFFIKTRFKDFYIKLKKIDEICYFFYKINITNLIALSVIIQGIYYFLKGIIFIFKTFII